MEIVIRNPRLANLAISREMTDREIIALRSDIEMYLMKEKSVVCDEIKIFPSGY